MAEVLVHRVRRVTVPQGWQRARAVKPGGRHDCSDQFYDFETLFYQAIRLGSDVVLVAPKLLNFEVLLRQSQFFVGGSRVERLRIQKYYRHAVITLTEVSAGDSLKIQFPNGAEASGPIVAPRLGHLGSLNCELMISKDNDLTWIEERIAFHSARCQVDGLCFVDNGSTAYDLASLARVIERSNVKRAVIVSMPFPFGGLNKRPRHAELYLQTAAYNLCRLMFLRASRATAILDVDEVLLPQPQGRSVFDAACRSRLGFVRFGGENRLPGSSDTPPFAYAQHMWMRPDKRYSHKTWCIDPKGPLGHLQWRCHNLERNVFARWQTLRGQYFYHCLGIGTGWKNKNRARAKCPLLPDPQARKFWRDTYLAAVSKRV